MYCVVLTCPVEESIRKLVTIGAMGSVKEYNSLPSAATSASVIIGYKHKNAHVILLTENHGKYSKKVLRPGLSMKAGQLDSFTVSTATLAFQSFVGECLNVGDNLVRLKNQMMIAQLIVNFEKEKDISDSHLEQIRKRKYRTLVRFP